MNQSIEVLFWHITPTNQSHVVLFWTLQNGNRAKQRSDVLAVKVYKENLQFVDLRHGGAPKV